MGEAHGRFKADVSDESVGELQMNEAAADCPWLEAMGIWNAAQREREGRPTTRERWVR